MTTRSPNARTNFRPALLLFAAGALLAALPAAGRQPDGSNAPATEPQSAEPAASGQGASSPPQVVPALPVPRLIKFTGMLNDSSGQPRIGPVGLTFAIYKDQQGGAALWMESQNATLDPQGRYTVLLGSTQSEGVPLALFASGEPRWLGLQVQLPGEVEQPRVLLVSVPYALKAADADTLGGKPATAFVTTELTAATPAASTNATSPGAIPNVSGTGTPNTLPKWMDNAGTLADSAVVESGGLLQAPAFGFSTNVAPPTTPVATIFNQSFVGPVFSGLSFKVRTGATTPADALAIDSSQNVSVAGNTTITGNASALSFTFSGNAAPPTTPSATIFNQAFVGPVFSGLSFKVRTGSTTPADALSIDLNQNVSIPAGDLILGGTGKGIVFPDGSRQTTAATGGGGGGGTVTSITAGAGLVGAPNPITAAGTLVLDTAFTDGRYAQLNVVNNFTANQNITGNVTLTGNQSTTGSGAFTAATANQVLSVSQTGAGSGLSATSAGAFGIQGVSTTGTGVFGRGGGLLSAADPGSFGVQGLSDNAAGVGVSGHATAVGNVANIGVMGRADGNNAIGVFGRAPQLGNVANIGVAGEADGQSGIAVRGHAFSATGQTFGVQGIADSTGGTGVMGHSTALTGAGSVGVQGVADSPGGAGLYGENTAQTGQALGVEGISESPQGVAILGDSLDTTGAMTSVGVLGRASSGNSVGVMGKSNTGTGVQGLSFDFLMGIVAVAGSPVRGVGVQGVSDNPSGAGVLGHAADTTGTGSPPAAGVFGISDSPTGLGVSGFASSASGVSVGVLGRSQSPTGLGVIGESSVAAISPSPGPVGVQGITDMDGGVGVSGMNIGFPTMPSFGVKGAAAGNSGTGVQGNGNLSGVTGLNGALSTPSTIPTDAQPGVVGNGGTGVLGLGAGATVAQGESLPATGVFGKGIIGVRGSAKVGGVAGRFDSDGSAALLTGVSNGVTKLTVDGVGNMTLAGGLTTPFGINIAALGSPSTFGGSVSISGALTAGGNFSTNGNATVFGSLTVNGTKSSVAELADGRRVALYAVEAPENWFEDFGRGILRHGVAWVDLEPTFAETVNPGMGYHVFLTPIGDCQGLYVARMTATGFEVRELRHGRSQVAFDYRIVARRRGFENVRLKEVAWPTAQAKP